MARLIDMDKTMDELRAYAERKFAAGHIELANGILKAVNYIGNNMVRVDAMEVAHGYTIPADEPKKVLLDRKCGICDQLMLSTDVFCPMCGARMDGDGNG